MKSGAYKSCRYFVPSSLLTSQTAENVAARARKRAMQPQSLTYSELLEKQAYFVTTGQLNAQTAANRATALRAFLRTNHLVEGDIVGDEMRSGFANCMERYLDSLRDAGKKQRRLTNDRAALKPWKQMVVEWDTTRALNSEKPTPFRAQVMELVGDRSIKRVANDCRVPYDMLVGWLHGKIPRQSSARYIARIEGFYGMERGALLALTGFSHTPKLYPALGEPPKIEYRETLSAKTQDHYWLRVPEDSPLRRQWGDFTEYKTAAVPLLERSSKGQWRYSPLPFARNTPANWFTFHDGNEVPSAKPAWAKVGGYLGWLTLPTERGGFGMPSEAAQTMAWLVVPQLLQRHIDWRKARADGKVTSALPEMLGWIQSLMRAEVGYFPQSPWLRETLPEEYRTDSWDAMCAKQMKFCRRLAQSMNGQVEVSRGGRQDFCV